MTEEKVILTGDWLVVSEVLSTFASGFAAYGYELKGVTLNGSPKLRLFPIFEMRNSRIRVSMEIAFTSADTRRGGGFTVLIVRRDNRKLDVKDYVKEHGGGDLTDLFRYRDPNIDVREFANNFFSKLLKLMEKELNPIVNGYKFEETPINWMGYK